MNKGMRVNDAQRCTKGDKTVQDFRWTRARARAANLVADDHFSDQEIAARVGVCRRTLAYWKAHPVFTARVQARIDGMLARSDAEFRASLDRRYPLSRGR